MHEYQVGDRVRLVPTQGGHQKPLDGNVTKVTRTQVVVVDEKHHWGVTYKREGGLPAFKADRGFPCYRVEPVKN